MMNKQRFSEEKGASSILVIIMMVVLLVFGLAILTTSLSNVRLGERKRSWLREYYSLEGTAQTAIADYDRLLLDSETQALAYMDSKTYEADYDLSDPLPEEMYLRVLSMAYFDILSERLSAAIAGNDQAALYLHDGDPFAVLEGKDSPSGKLDFTVRLPESKYDKSIRITMNLLNFTADNLSEEGFLENRYHITRHTQQQEAFQLDESIDFGDPFDDVEEGNPFSE